MKYKTSNAKCSNIIAGIFKLYLLTREYKRVGALWCTHLPHCFSTCFGFKKAKMLLVVISILGFKHFFSS